MGLFSKVFGGSNNAAPQAPAAPTPELDKSQPGSMMIDDIFTIAGRGTIVTGKIESGFFYVGQKAAIVSETGETLTVIAGVEQFRKVLGYAGPGENVGILLKDVSRDNINMGDTLQGIQE